MCLLRDPGFSPTMATMRAAALTKTPCEDHDWRDPAQVRHWIEGPLLKRANAALTAAGAHALHRVEVTFDLRGLAAGQASMTRDGARIRLNPALLELPGARDEVHNTACHEMAHLCQFVSCPGAPAHGAVWKRFALALGAKPQRCHRLPLPRARRRREYLYVVAGREIWLGATRHGRLQRGVAKYRTRIAGRQAIIIARDFAGTWRWR